jgi:hypothetical protein
MNARRLLVALFTLALAGRFAAFGQIFSVNIVGYINHTFAQGGSLFGNQLANGDNTLNVLFGAAPAIPDGTSISVWDPAAGNFLAPSIYSQASGWSINYALPPGVGARIQAPAAFTITFVGAVVGYDLASGTVILPAPPPNGLQLLASRTPLEPALFEYSMGRAPREGESVTRLDPLTGTYFTTTFHGGSWDNGAPELSLMEAAFYNLGPVAVPEPSVLALGAAGLALLFIRHRREVSWPGGRFGV